MAAILQRWPTPECIPVFEEPGFKLYNDDSLVVLGLLPNNSVDTIFADPPYMLSNDGFTCQAGRMVSVNKGKWDKSKGFENDLIFHETWISECRRILKPEALSRETDSKRVPSKTARGICAPDRVRLISSPLR